MSHYEDRLEVEGPETVTELDPGELPQVHATDPPDVPSPDFDPEPLEEPSDASAPSEREAAAEKAMKEAGPAPDPVTVGEMRVREAFFRARERAAQQSEQEAAGPGPVVKVLAVVVPLAAVWLIAS